MRAESDWQTPGFESPALSIPQTYWGTMEKERIMMEYEFWYDDGSTEVVKLPSHNEVCHRCQGNGTQDVWEGGMTGDEMAEQGPEFFDDYMSGMYSKPCEVCHGRNVVEVVSLNQLTATQLINYEKTETKKAEAASADASEAAYFNSFGSHLGY